MKLKDNTPELLAPAGSPEALDAAIAAGADAVYFGGQSFNARMNARNFDGDALSEAIRKCRFYGVKTNITLNTLVLDREMDGVLRYVEELYKLGADALIIADLGAARLIHEYFPDFELHASTQVSGHNTPAAVELSKLGFTRMVAARELSLTDLSILCRKSPIETELFIHGAICVSQSGQCLASSLIGSRSGNRGECAQPCRLPYKCAGCNKESYALSLKDLCLAGHVTEILKLGAASLKIEGRMKPPGYVYGVTSIYRRLLDERRNASNDEIAELRALFSRSGFTDGYFVSKIGREMLGVRTDADKAMSATGETANYAKLCEWRRRPAELKAEFRQGEPSRLTICSGGYEATALGQMPEAAKSCPMTAEAVAKSLTKLGGTPFMADIVEINIDNSNGGLMLPMSSINALRREAVAKLTEMFEVSRTACLPEKLEPALKKRPEPLATARFQNTTSIPENSNCFDIIYIPLEEFKAESKNRANGVIIPPVIFDSELDEVRAMLASAKNEGIKHALVSNIGHISLAIDAGMIPHGDFRLNVYNSYAADALFELGVADIIASPELTLPQLRDLMLPAVIYGRIPLMTLEKCVIRDLYSCRQCSEKGFLPIVDRMGITFWLKRSWKHRNIMYNSVPVYMADKQNELERYGLQTGHFIFSDETSVEAAKIIEAYRRGLTTDKKIRRIPK
jgi:putative protease